MILSKEISRTIEQISAYQFKGRIPVTAIVNWLGNFEDCEIESALKLLEKVEYFTLTDLSNILSGYLKNFLGKDKDVPKGTELHFIPLGKAGKSGHIISYLVKNLFKGNTPTGLKVNFYNQVQDLRNETLTSNDIVFLLDDIIGSGSTFLRCVCDKDTINELKLQPLANEDGEGHYLMSSDAPHRMILLSCIIMATAKERIEKLIPHLTVLGEVRHKAFSKGESPFHSYKTVLILRELAYKYGKRLISSKYPGNILGFDNSQALILFDHATPNNTLPIFWRNVNGWEPLLSRSHMERIKYARTNRETNNRWLIKLSDLFDVDPAEISDSNLFNPDNYSLAYILRLRIKGWNEVEICREMGYALDELGEKIALGQEIKLWDEHFNPTQYSIKRVAEVEKKLRMNEEFHTLEEFDDRNLIYCPTTFGGIS